MKITEINRICDLIGGINVSIIGYAELWTDFARDYPVINDMLDNIPDELRESVISLTAAYVKGWMRAGGHKQ